MSATDPAEDGATASGTSPSAAREESGVFECNICLDTAKDAVVSMCGHLFCWPCLHQWLETRPNRQTCPVCKAGISREKVVPLYGRGSTNQQDPRDKPIPPRPQGQRSEPQNTGGFPGFNFGDSGFQMSFGIGAFPFGIFASSGNLNDGRHSRMMNGSGVHHQGAGISPSPPGEGSILSKLFLILACVFILFLLIS